MGLRELAITILNVVTLAIALASNARAYAWVWPGRITKPTGSIARIETLVDVANSSPSGPYAWPTIPA